MCDTSSALPWYECAIDSWANLGRRIAQMTNEKREGAFLFQRLSMVIQRYNAVAIKFTFVLTSAEDEL